jgi:hypothetical protein
MEVRHINNVFVAKNCGRTSETNTIDGDSFTGVQVWAPTLTASGSTEASSYFGAGELVITNEAGTVQDSGISKIESIVFHLRDIDGKSTYRSKAIKGASITDYILQSYEAPVQQTAIITNTDVNDSHTYILRIRREGSLPNNTPFQKTISYTSDASATGAEIATGLVAEINANFNDDEVLPLTASVDSTDDTEIIITAKALPFEVGKFRYEQLRFVVEFVSFDADVEYNKGQTITNSNGDSYTACTKGNGTYEQVAELDWFAKQYTGRHELLNSRFPVTPIKLNVDEDETYDILTIRWNETKGSFSADTNQMGHITLALPVTDNATNQVDDILDTLDAYIVTNFGVGTAQKSNLT